MSTTRNPAPRPRWRRRLDDWAETTVAQAYRQGTRHQHSRLEAETVDPGLLAEGEALRAAVIDGSAAPETSATHRLALVSPGAAPGGAWMRGLMRALRHRGVSCSIIGSGSPRLSAALATAQPTIIVTSDLASPQGVADRDAIREYRRERQCAYLVLARPPYPHRWSATRALSTADAHRLEWMTSAGGPDGLLSFFGREAYEALMPEWASAGVPLLSLPAACDPFAHYPRPGVRLLDYFMVATREPDRVWVARRYLRPIFREYHGVWAGSGWAFGDGPLDPEGLGDAYASTRVALNPLHRDLVRHPLEISERTFSAAACGAFVLTDRTPLGARFFSDDEVVAVDGPKAFRAAFDHYVAAREERERIVARALRRVFAEHTYLHRATVLVEHVTALARA